MKSRSHAKSQNVESGDAALEVPDTAATPETGTNDYEVVSPKTGTDVMASPRKVTKGMMKPSALNETPKLSATEYQCEHCSKVCKSASGITNHRKSHRKSHKCQFCDKVFRYTDSLRDHTSQCHPEQLEKLTFSCRDCLKWFPTELALQDHMESSHTGPPKCMCEWCGRTVVRKLSS